MGVEAALIAAIAIQAGTQVYAGVEAAQSGKAQEKAAKEQAKLILEESQLEKARVADEFAQFNALQQLGFLSSGLSLLGTPSSVLMSNKLKQAQELKAIEVAGIAQSDFVKFEGRTAAREGRARMIGSFGQAASGVFTGVVAGQQAGLFNAPPVGPQSVPRISPADAGIIPGLKGQF